MNGMNGFRKVCNSNGAFVTLDHSGLQVEKVASNKYVTQNDYF